jgi:predicted patatin/cPLA2 family phospholipase
VTSTPNAPRYRLPLARLEAPPAGVLAHPAGFEHIRFTAGQAEAALARYAATPRHRRSGAGDWGLQILALSGGGAGGAFGAGRLAGLSLAGTRPQYDIVTGVSTGALMAPLAFLGPQWDDRLAEAFTGGRAAALLSLRALYRGDGLDVLVDHFIDEALVAAVAAEHRKGRRLFVATTNLDTQESIVWDLGAVAARGGDGALRLFRDVLAASACLPGLFPPKLIEVEAEGRRFEEMHVDGGTSSPLFILPVGAPMSPAVRAALHGASVYLIMNAALEPRSITTSPGRIAVMMRSFETMLHFSYRHAVELAVDLCARADLTLHVAAPPVEPDANGMLRFNTAAMRETFERARDAAAAGHAWSPGAPAA